MTLTIGSLFSGIGGLELGLERATGARTIWQVERDPFCQRVLAKHWPDATRYDDVCTASALPFVDVMCGGFPCQDISVAGKGAGIDGERSGLWREYARIIDETKPRTVVVENVAVIASRGLARVLHDLAGLGYMGTWGVVAAASVGAPHLRRRLFVVAAHPERVELRDKQGWRSGACWARAREPRHLGEAGPAAHTDVQHLDVPARPQRDEAPDVVGPGSGGSAADADVNAGGPRGADHACEGTRGRHPDQSPFGAWCGWVPASPVRRVDDGIPARVDGPRRRRPAADRHRLKALGNAVVPQVAGVVGRALMELVDFAGAH